MKHQAVKISCYVSIVCATLLSSCGAVTPIAQFRPTKTSTAFPLETSTPTPPASSETGIIRPENVNQLQILDEWEKGSIYGVALSPDETAIAVSTATGVYIYDFETLQEKQFIDLPITLSTERSYSPRKSISFSPDGNLLALGYDDITIWNLVENRIERRIRNQIADYSIVQIAYSPKGDTIVVMSMGGYAPCDAWGGNFALYSVDSGNLLYDDFFCPESALFHFSFLDNGNVAFVGITRDSNGWGYKASIVNATTGGLVETSSYESVIDSISPDGSKIATRDYPYSTKIIQTNSRNVVENIDGIVIYLPNNQKRLVQSKDGWVITTNDNKVICNFESLPHLQLDVYRSTFTIAGDKLIFWDYWYENVEVWDLAECKLVKQLFIPTGQDSFEYSDDGNFFATSCLSGVHIFDGKNGEYRFSISGNYNSQPTQYFDFSKDSKTVVVVSDVKPYTISFWDLASGRETQSISTNFEYIRYVSLNPDGTIVATIDYEGIHLWDVQNRSLLSTIPGRFGNISWNPNGSNFALIDGNNLIFYNAESGNIERSISIPKERFGAVFSKDWAYMGILEEEKLELWDISGHQLMDFQEYTPIVPTTTSSIIYDLQFSPDNNLLAAIHYDYENYSIRFWDTRTGMILRDAMIPFRISKLDFSPDGKRLFVLGEGIIYVLGIREKSQIRESH